MSPTAHVRRVALHYLPYLILAAVLATLTWSAVSVSHDAARSRRDVERVTQFEQNLCAQVNAGRQRTRVRNAVVKQLGQIQAEFLLTAITARRRSAPHESDPKLRASDLKAANNYERLRGRALAQIARLRNSPQLNCSTAAKPSQLGPQ